MIEWLQLTDEDRLVSIQQASTKSGISTKAIEKDWWVTLVLKAVFQSEFAPHLSFKGGTSLSKGWHLIGRLSEDIDLAIDRHFLGFEDELSKSSVKRLKRIACQFTSTTLKEAIERELAILGVPEGVVTVAANPVKENLPDTDPQILWINYPSLFDPIGYIMDSVKLEVSARSLNEPSVDRPILSLLGEYMPGYPWSGKHFPVHTVEPKRTFLEKAFLLHEEFLRTTDKIVHERMSRHLYDLERLMDTEHAKTALTDYQYYTAIVEHRRHLIFKAGVDYDTHNPKTVNFIPPDGVMAAFEKDYALMREQMIYDENTKDFAAIIERLRQLLEILRQIRRK
ncbi:nucleotidyl transferase AbiEii/AbiGii toxin family protein [Olivibacter sitiensis]|uniref:nucleotidyl transferase AbiEii/AbiGii toxin family protein n=1 Tax=Olivibacter sitiensis TaxID=376470 RepID=UPI00040D21D6|nr:nucleotidyl transferase AbiEii/AbiGii toxin family protein [Olivibacter sitiensis]